MGPASPVPRTLFAGEHALHAGGGSSGRTGVGELIHCFMIDRHRLFFAVQRASGTRDCRASCSWRSPSRGEGIALREEAQIRTIFMPPTRKSAPKLKRCTKPAAHDPGRQRSDISVQQPRTHAARRHVGPGQPSHCPARSSTVITSKRRHLHRTVCARFRKTRAEGSLELRRKPNPTRSLQVATCCKPSMRRASKPSEGRRFPLHSRGTPELPPASRAPLNRSNQI